MTELLFAKGENMTELLFAKGEDRREISPLNKGGLRGVKPSTIYPIYP
jgi:hypothetical protein